MDSNLSIEQQAYLHGFAVKCAEVGVDPDELVKEAQRGRMGARFMRQLQNLIYAPSGGPLSKLLSSAPTSGSDMRYAIQNMVDPTNWAGAGNIFSGKALVDAVVGGPSRAAQYVAQRGTPRSSAVAKRLRDLRKMIRGEAFHRLGLNKYEQAGKDAVGMTRWKQLKGPAVTPTVLGEPSRSLAQSIPQDTLESVLRSIS